MTTQSQYERAIEFIADMDEPTCMDHEEVMGRMSVGAVAYAFIDQLAGVLFRGHEERAAHALWRVANDVIALRERKAHREALERAKQGGAA